MKISIALLVSAGSSLVLAALLPHDRIVLSGSNQAPLHVIEAEVDSTSTSQPAYDDASASPELYRIELFPGNERWVTEEEKWALKRQGQRFLDVTHNPSLGELRFGILPS